MKRHTRQTSTLRADRYGRRITHQLDNNLVALHPDIAERLRIAREQAVAHHRVVLVRSVASVQGSLPSSELALSGGWWSRLSTMFPLAILVVGLICISVLEDEQLAHELADVDTELLTDELPPSAYVDPGFAKFLQLKGRD